MWKTVRFSRSGVWKKWFRPRLLPDRVHPSSPLARQSPIGPTPSSSRPTASVRSATLRWGGGDRSGRRQGRLRYRLACGRGNRMPFRDPIRRVPALDSSCDPPSRVSPSYTSRPPTGESPVAPRRLVSRLLCVACSTWNLPIRMGAPVPRLFCQPAIAVARRPVVLGRPVGIRVVRPVGPPFVVRASVTFDSGSQLQLGPRIE